MGKMSTNQPVSDTVTVAPGATVTIVSTAVVADLGTFVKNAFGSYKNKLNKFIPIATDPLLGDASKSSQASVYIRDVSKLMAFDYIASNPGFVDDGTLNYNIAMFLLNDGRVRNALGLDDGLWGEMCSLQQFLDANSFNFFSTTVTAADELRAEMVFCGCF